MSQPVDRLRAALASRYGIERELGHGGMATVFLAEDLKHHRKVALKILRPDLAAALGAERFLHEIRVTANLQHPHILPLHDSGEVDGLVYYVMPYVDGESLRDRLQREKQLPMEDAIAITTSVASALDYAHRHHVIHRDIKPENILLHDGQALVADFGIALAVSAAGGSRLTETGLSLGTPTYMSPEQAAGDRHLDGRTDVYSLGCVLYEMLTGDAPFTGSTAQAIVAKIITDRPRRPSELRDTVPPPIDSAVLRALAKLPADRFATAGQFADALTRGTTTSYAVATGAPGTRWARRDVALTAAVLLALGAAAWGWLRGPQVPPRPVIRVALDLEVPRTSFGSISPDGTELQLLGGARPNRVIFLRNLSTFGVQAIPGTEGVVGSCFSPDGQSIAFFTRTTLNRTTVRGGHPTVLVDSVRPQGADPSWGDDGTIFYVSSGSLWGVTAAGGKAEMIAAPERAAGQAAFGFPLALPGSKGVLLILHRTDGTSGLVVFARSSRRITTIVPDAADVRYVPGYVIFSREDGSIYGLAFDAERLTPRGAPILLLQGVYIGVRGYSYLTVSRNGTLVYVPDSVQDALVSVDRHGTERTLFTSRSSIHAPRISPNGQDIAFQLNEKGKWDIWTYSVPRATLTRLTNDGVSVEPAWTPDGRRVVYSSGAPDRHLLWQSADGGRPADTLYSAPGQQLNSVWSPDGKSLVFRQVTPGSPAGLWTLTLGPPRVVRPFVEAANGEIAPAISPDGRWLAYSSGPSGPPQTYVRPFPGPGGERYQISADGGVEPHWSRSGGEIYYWHGDSLIVAPIRYSPAFTVGPRALRLYGEYAHVPGATDYDVFADGRILLVRRLSQATVATLVVNWTAEWTHP